MAGQQLTVGDFGDEVARLHENLIRGGFAVSAEEIKRRFFGPATRAAVADCQRRNQLEVTGEVGEATVAVLSAAASGATPVAPAPPTPQTPPAWVSPEPVPINAAPAPTAESSLSNGWHPIEVAGPGPSAAAGDSGIAAVSRDSTHMDVFWVGEDGSVYVASWTAGEPWKQPERVTESNGASKAAGVAAVSRFPSHKEVWWVAEADGSIQGAYWYQGYTKWERFTVPGSQGASKLAGIAALSRRADHMEVWWIHQNGSVWHSWFSESLPEGHKWIEQPVQVPKAINASTIGGLAVVSRAETDIDVWWVDNNKTVQHSGFTEQGDQRWDQKPEPVPNATGACTTTGIAALSRSDDHMEVWWVDTNGTVQHSWWTKDKKWVQRPEPVPNATGASTNGGIAAISRSATRMDVWWVDKNGNLQGSWWTADGSWAKQPYLIPAAQGVSTTAGIAALSRSGDHMEVWWIGPQGSVQGAWWQDVAPPPPPAAPVLDNSTREVLKGTLDQFAVPAQVSADLRARGGTGGLTKLVAIRQLELKPGDTQAVLSRLSAADGTDENKYTPRISTTTIDLLSAFEQPLLPSLQPDIAAASEAPADELATFAKALVNLRAEQLQRTHQTRQAEAIGQSAMYLNAAVLAARQLAAITPPVGMLHLERIEMVPAGIERGELVATIPLAPGEETAVTHKEWSVTSREFTKIVTDELEEVSETGVTDNTELAQSTSSQTEHSNQFNITGTVQGGIPIISGSATTSFTAQDRKSDSATASLKHARTLTQKASRRSKQEHKITISTKTETGTEQTSTRIIKNTRQEPIRIDYFSLMRKWRVRLYRYGLRLTYDLVIPEPAATMRRAYKELAELRDKLKPFTFGHKNDTAYLLEKVDEHGVPNEETGRPRYLWLEEQYGASVPRYPAKPGDQVIPDKITGDNRFGYVTVDFEVPKETQIVHIVVTAVVGRMDGAPGDQDTAFDVIGASNLNRTTRDPRGIHFTEKACADNLTPFMAGLTGPQRVTVFLRWAGTPLIGLRVVRDNTPEAIEQWRNDVWTALLGAAQEKYYAEQQDIAAQIAALEEELANVDTLTLRREESDEIMKSVLRFILGPKFACIPSEVLDLFTRLKLDIEHGTVFDEPILVEQDPGPWSAIRQQEDKVRFINQAIEWENVVSFLYSYFWDIDKSWPFIRGLRHPDANRQAFLRAGAARVVLTVRKGWEGRWIHFSATGIIKQSEEELPPDPTDPYLTIAQEIAAYDNHNYPGIPPANPERSAVRLQDAVYTTSSADINAAATKIPVVSSKGFVVGLPVLLDSYDSKVQEEVLITAIPNDHEISVEKTKKPHHGTQTPFAVLQPGERGALIAEWNEYTPSSGTDIAITSNLVTIY